MSVHGVDFLCGEIGSCATCYALPAAAQRRKEAKIMAELALLDAAYADDDAAQAAQDFDEEAAEEAAQDETLRRAALSRGQP